MSGVEVLAGIGILCSAMQIVTFGKDVLHVYRHIRENGTVDPRLESYLTDASKSYDEMKKQLSTPSVLPCHQQEVVNIGEEAHQRLQKFKTHFEELYVDPVSRKGFRGKLRVARGGFKALFRARELEDLEKNFERYQQLFQTRLIQRVCSQGDATALLAQGSFKNLDTTQQFMVKKIAEGHIEISRLVSQQAAEVKDHVTTEHEESRIAMGAYLHATENNLQSHISESICVVQQDMAYRNKTEDEIKTYNQLMTSLRYPGMNSRKNQVIENFPEMFQWIFSSNVPRDEDSYSSNTDSTDDYSTEDENQRGSKDSGDSDDQSRNEKQSDEESYKEGCEVLASNRSGEKLYHDSAGSNASSSDDSTEFTKWLGSESKLFWISGKPGSGKSTLMKFIATTSATHEHITPWRFEVRICSHYFWKAGSSMERSMKGLILSLTYQVLLDKVALAHRLLEAMPEVRQKWSYGDWDLQELERTLIWVLEGSGEAFFLLIDGLDESEEVGSHLSMVPRGTTIFDKLGKLQDVKTCVSSREEYVFAHHFEGTSRLRIHELTKHDIRQFAVSRLKTTHFAHSNDQERILELIVGKADGVFLWVALVLGSVTRAFRIDDCVEKIIERVNHMPRDLIKLVRDMWERSGDDGELPSYRASASRYFNLALTQLTTPGLTQFTNPGNACSFLNFTIASKGRTVGDTMDLSHTWDAAELVTMCSATEKELSVVCHGLLEAKVDTYLPIGMLPKPLRCYGKMSATFTHRCVFDFLQDTEDGSALLSACGWHEGEALGRRFGANMILDSLFAPKFEVDISFEEAIMEKRYVLIWREESFVGKSLSYIAHCGIAARYAGFLFRKCHEWHMAGLWLDRCSWRYLGRSVFREDPLTNEFIAFMAQAASISLTQRLIEALPTQDFLNALPAVFRGKVSGISGLDDDDYDDSEEGGWSDRLKRAILTRKVLIRLLRLQEDGFNGDIPLKASSGETREDLKCLVCSWFLGSLKMGNYGQYDDTVRKLELEVLQLIGLALSRPEDWDQSVLLSLQYFSNSATARGFMHYAFGDKSCDFYVVVNLATIYQIFLRFLQRSALSLHSAHGISIMNEQLSNFPNGMELSLRIVLIMKGAPIGQICRNEFQHQDSQILLDSLLTGRCLTDQETAAVKGRGGNPVAHGRKGVLSYLISELGHVPGLPMHPWSAWFVYDVSEHDGAEDLEAQGDEKSRESFRKVIEEISQDL